MSSVAIDRRDMRDGFIAIGPVLVAMVPFALVLGATAVQKGLSPLEVFLMSALVFAGSAQFVAVELWTPDVAVGLLIAMTLLVNARHVLMGAALAPQLPARGPMTLLGLFFLVDEVWALALARRRIAPLTWRYWAALGLPLYVNWLLWTSLGALVGGVIDDPAALGFDFAFVAIFVVLLKGMAPARSEFLIWAAAALVSALTYKFMPGPLFVPLGALAGCLVAFFISSPERAR